MLKHKLIVTGLAAAGIVGAVAFDEYQALRSARASWLMTTIGAPFCAPDRDGPQYKTFFRLAMAQPESASAPRKTEVGPFSKAIPDAESLAKADANPVLMDNLGNMQYRVTTSSPEAQQFFDQGLRLAYAFNHAEAVRAFRKARTLDPGCAMCWWGEALVLGPNINAPMDAESVPAASEAVRGARAAAAKATPKERALIDAVAARYAADVGADRSALDKAYADAMEKVAVKYPDDAQIAVLFAESLMDLQPWDYWEGGSKPKGRAGDIQAQLEKVLKAMPDHPGAIHYYIHLVEASTDPKRALPHAQRLGKLMPGAGHVVHMPFHTFFRVGLFKEAVEANKKAVAADEAFIAQSTPVGLYPMA
jgi:tetratricopeptide (TPR) repeat protein